MMLCSSTDNIVCRMETGKATGGYDAFAPWDLMLARTSQLHWRHWLRLQPRPGVLVRWLHGLCIWNLNRTLKANDCDSFIHVSDIVINTHMIFWLCHMDCTWHTEPARFHESGGGLGTLIDMQQSKCNTAKYAIGIWDSQKQSET